MNRPLPFGKYILLERISVGGMAEVFKGRTFGIEGFARYVAIKRILPHLAEDNRFVEMFIDEAKMAVQLNHAHIAQVIELGREKNDHFIAMEYIAGKDLLALYHHMRRSRQRMPVHLVALIGHRVAEGLDYAHRKRGSDGRPLGIVHRDVSPQNVLVSYDGAVKLIDFGIAKVRKQGYEATRAGVLKGKFGYMSPELIEARTVDARADVFSLGVVLWELLATERLFAGDNEFVTLELVRRAEVDAPSTRNPAVPPELDRIILRALARDPEARYQTAAELADDLARFLHTQGFSPTNKDLAAWMRGQFSQDLESERLKSQQHARITLGPDGEVVQGSQDEEEEEPTALWQPDDGMADEWARATSPPDEVEPVPDPLAALDAPRRAAPAPERPLSERPLSERPLSERPFSERPTDQVPIGDRPTALRPQVGVQRGRGALWAALVVGLLATAAAGWWFLWREPPASLLVRVNPSDSLTIRLGDEVIGQASPARREGLKPGRQVLEVTRDGFDPWRQDIMLTAGEVTTVDVRLALSLSNEATLRFLVTPPDAHITLGGKEVHDGEARAPAGVEVALVIERAGYRPVKASLTPERGRQTLRYELALSPGTLFVETDPPGTVFLGEERRGRTPVRIDGLDPSKPWPVRVEAPGHKPHEETVEFKDRRFVQVEATLQPQ